MSTFLKFQISFNYSVGFVWKYAEVLLNIENNTYIVCTLLTILVVSQLCIYFESTVKVVLLSELLLQQPPAGDGGKKVRVV